MNPEENQKLSWQKPSYGWLRERDIDLLVCAELHANGALTRLFAQMIGAQAFSFEAAWVSDSDLDGETDLVLVFGSAQGRAVALIENKIAASFQPEQALRYLHRAERWAERDDVILVVPTLLAPAEYFSRPGCEPFKVRVSYEAACDALRSETDARSKFLAASLEEAVSQLRSGYVMVPDALVTDAWQYFWQTASDGFPKLRMKRPDHKPGKSTWVYFREAEGFEKCRSTVSLVYKAERGQADLQFASMSMEHLQSTVGSLIESDMQVVQAKKSASVRIVVPTIEFASDPTAQKEKIIAGLLACDRLRQFFAERVALII